MSNLSLTAQSALGGIRRDFEGVSLAEVGGHALVSVATPLGGGERLAKAIASSYGAKLPTVGYSSLSDNGRARFLGLQPDQMFLLFEHEDDEALAAVTGQLGDAGYYTDQSDSWAMLRISGPAGRTALERICMLDLHPDSFDIDAVARTTMEHLGVIILREAADSFLLMSPRSSATSFLHAIETSIINVTE